MIGAMTGKGTVAGECAGADEFEPAIGRRSNVIRVEIDQASLIFYSVRIMAGRARGFLIDDVKTMAPILA